MGTYKGNVGNLMQHWTLCKILTAAQKHKRHSGLNYIDAHAMAPLTKPENPVQIAPYFAQVQRNLPGQNSVYERAWHDLVPTNPRAYPNSGAFVRKVWEHDYSLLLCENRNETANEIDAWLPGTRYTPRCQRANLSQGDWRDRFDDGLPTPNDVGLSADALTLVSFDPYLYSTNTFANGPNLYREDLARTLGALACEGPVIIQLSTYEAQNNHQGAVISSVNSVLYGGGFGLAAVVRVNGRMMSLIYAREVEWAADLAGLPDNFTNWLDEVKRRMRAQVR